MKTVLLYELVFSNKKLAFFHNDIVEKWHYRFSAILSKKYDRPGFRFSVLNRFEFKKL